MSALTDHQAAAALAYAVETRRFEIERFWQRSLFFWGMVAAAFIGFAQLKDFESRFVVGCFGIVTSVAWSLQNRGAKYWQESWETKVHLLQRRVLGVDLFSHKEPVEEKGWFGASRYSVSKLAVMLSDVAALAWLLLTTQMVRFACPEWADPLLSSAMLGTGLIVVALLFKGRASSDV